MIHTPEMKMAFYQQLGKVFYAIAAADRTIRKEELAALRNIVKSEWLKIDQTMDEFGTDSAYQIEIVFDWLSDKEANPNDIINDLKAFQKEHPSLFTLPIKELIMRTATAIASSFHGNNKSELTILNSLKSVLLKTKP